ncbi:hypothetical protein Vadar_001174 [Vaccinium darrowii]|uniref:Uncharacterized protein n=1 Tax=Vaccinium darrowii TaxID=229202 RepID=A0ACB7XNM4_9ERIC|nr:hypothetical protein Vadar_001174 [Vaccinium darrowii]
MEDLPLHRIQISGPTLSSLLQRFSSSPGDINGLLFGHITHSTPSTFSDDTRTATSLSPPSSPTLVATITSFFSCPSPSTFYSSTGQITPPSLSSLLPPSSSLLGWFSARRKTPLRPSLRESSVTSSLSSTTHLSVPIINDNLCLTLPPSIFLLLTTPFPDQTTHTHEYRAYQFRLSSDSFEPKTLDVVNLGPGFRSHYDSFCPNNSSFPMLPCASGSEVGESLATLRRVSKDQKELDTCAEGFDVGRLSRLGFGAGKSQHEAEVQGCWLGIEGCYLAMFFFRLI